jgi:hypothetical protein
MGLFGRESSRSISRQAREHALIDPDDEIVGYASGMCAGMRNAVLTYVDEPTTLGFTQHRLVIISTNRVAAVDLVALLEVEVKSGGGEPYLAITAVRDRDPGFSTWTFKTPAVAQFTGALQQAAKSSRAARAELARIFKDWGEELRRRNLASQEIVAAIDAEPGNPFIDAEAMLVHVRSLAHEPMNATVDPVFEVEGSLLALRDGRVVLMVHEDEENAPVAMFRKEDITYLTLPGPSSTPGVGGTWEIGFRSGTAERRVILDGPRPSLFPGNEDSADAFLNASGLLSGEGVGNIGASWRTSREETTPQVTAVTARVGVARGAGRSRPPSKRRR